MKDKILIVDDTQLNRELLKDILCEEYDILEAENGREALDIVRHEMTNIAAILLDLIMPVMDGFTFLEELQKLNIMDKVPILVISGEKSVQNEKKCFDYGVSDFIGRPFNSVLVTRRVQNVVNHYAYKNKLEEKVEEQTSSLREAYNTLKIQAEKLQKRNQEIIDMLGNIVEYRNLESGEHIQRVKGYTKILAKKFSMQYPEYNLDKDTVATIVDISALHDIGKIAIPDSVLLKPGKLTKEEFEYMKTHTIRGCEILDKMGKDWEPKFKKISMEIVRYHHERYDGKGYPDGLKGEDIPVSAQIVSLADVYDALVSERCYKNAYSKDQAFNMIVGGECGVFSPKLIEVFREVRNDFENFADNPIKKKGKAAIPKENC